MHEGAATAQFYLKSTKNLGLSKHALKNILDEEKQKVHITGGKQVKALP